MQQLYPMIYIPVKEHPANDNLTKTYRLVLDSQKIVMNFERCSGRDGMGDRVWEHIPYGTDYIPPATSAEAGEFLLERIKFACCALSNFGCDWPCRWRLEEETSSPEDNSGVDSSAVDRMTQEMLQPEG